MITVGVSELKRRASELIRMVSDTSVKVQIARRGKVVALLVPVNPQIDKKDEQRAWTEIDTLVAEIGAHLSKDVSATEAVKEIRR